MTKDERRIMTREVEPDTGNASVLALIPAHNEAQTIARVVTGAGDHLPVLVVDDGSTDDTATLAQSAGAAVLRQVPNQGKGEALRAGFRRALAEGAEAVVTLDGDGQHDPAEIPRFLAAYRARRADLIVGERDFGQMPPVRQVANWLGRWVFSWALGQDIRDNQSGYRLVGRRLMEAMLTGRESGFEFEMEMITTCLRNGLVLDWVPIRTIYAGEASHINNLQHVKNFLRVAWQARRGRQGPE
jgi:glycosyltransferase involved in cell wall biosynthesis